MQVKVYKLFTQILGGILFITGFTNIAWSWPPGDLLGWVFTFLGITALWVGQSPQR